MLSLRWHHIQSHGLKADSAGEAKVSKQHSHELHDGSTHQSQITLSEKSPSLPTIFPRAIEPSPVDKRKSLSPSYPLVPRKKGPLWGTTGILPPWETVNAQCFPVSPFSATDLQRPHLVNKTSSRRPEILPRNVTVGLCMMLLYWYKSHLPEITSPIRSPRLGHRKTQFIPSSTSCLANSMSMDEILVWDPSCILNT